jgi:Mrp family chromosome partitioning ATPase
VGTGGGPQDLQRLAHHSPDFGTTVLTAGTPLPDTVAAIMTPALPELLTAWRREYDWIVIDSPPAFVAETSALAQHAELVLLVARPGVVEKANLKHAMEALGRTNTPRGLVLNAVGRQHAGYHYGSGYYYYHASYGREADAVDSKAKKRVAS